MITVRIPDDLRDRIDALRPSTVSREAWIRNACVLKANALEDQHRPLRPHPSPPPSKSLSSATTSTRP